MNRFCQDRKPDGTCSSPVEPILIYSEQIDGMWWSGGLRAEVLGLRALVSALLTTPRTGGPREFLREMESYILESGGKFGPTDATERADIKKLFDLFE